MSTLKLYKYYFDKKIDPVPINLNNKKNYLDHKRKRINLLTNHLKIKPKDFLNKNIIEFGCNTGENSLIISKLGGKLTLVEPNELAISKIVKNFKKHKELKRLKKIIHKDIESFQTKKKFDFVFAEGFLNTLKNRNKELNKLFNLCSDNGSLIINYDDKIGGFIELLKSVILIKITQLNKKSYEDMETFQIAKKLYLKSFQKLNTSRTFKAWYQDQLTNPFASKTWSLREILNEAEKKKFICFSTSPLLKNENFYQWYKNYNKKLKTNEIFLRAIDENLEYLITGKLKKLNHKEKKNFYIKKIINISNQFSNIIKKKNLKIKINFDKKDLNFLNKNNKLLKKEIIKTLNLINNSINSDEIIKFYTKTKKLKNTWGSILHYVHLVKNF